MHICEKNKNLYFQKKIITKYNDQCPHIKCAFKGSLLMHPKHNLENKEQDSKNILFACICTSVWHHTNVGAIFTDHAAPGFLVPIMLGHYHESVLLYADLRLPV